MKKLIAGFVMFTAVAWAGASFACGNCGCPMAKAGQANAAVAAPEVAAAAAPAASAPENAGNKVCPFMGVAVDPANAVHVEYKGKVYNLCCNSCKAAFLKDPEAAVKKFQ